MLFGYSLEAKNVSIKTIRKKLNSKIATYRSHTLEMWRRSDADWTNKLTWPLGAQHNLNNYTYCELNEATRELDFSIFQEQNLPLVGNYYFCLIKYFKRLHLLFKCGIWFL